MTAGIVKPFIFLPEDLLEKLTDNQFHGVLMHEASHIRHRDQAAGILQRLVKAIFWWNPFAYALSKTHARAREEISDNHVLLLSDSREYAECLIDLAEKSSRFKHAAATVGMGAPHIPLKSRIKYILSREKKMETSIKKSTIAMLLLAALLLTAGITGSRIILASDVTAPQLIKRVDPVYPQEAKQAGIEGTVVIAAQTDSSGNVTRLEILKGAHSTLNQAAAQAVIQWEYQPMMIDETVYGISFTVTCRFMKDKEKPEIQISQGIAEGIQGGIMGSVEGGVPGEVQGGVIGGVMRGVVDEIDPVRATGDIKPPKLIKTVEPVYPEVARQAQVEGLVILEATTDKYGRVQSAHVLRPLSPALNQAAVEAVKQWIYEPAVIDGEPRGVTFTVTVNFKLDKPQPEPDIESVKEETPPFEPVRAAGGIKPPTLIKRVDPVYPEEAEEQRIEGSVILEVTTNPYGRVHDIKVLRSVPTLDRAAIDAVKQWVYAPKTIDGQPRGMIFTVTVTFRLKK
jgi:TonB family protein